MSIVRMWGLASILIVAMPTSVVAAEGFPTKTIEIIVPYAAGGGVDLTARIVAEHAKARLPQPLVVVNRTGGAGAVGLTAAAQARPDGHTLVMLSNAAVSDEFLVKGARYTFRSYTPIAQVAFDPVVLVVQKGGPYEKPIPALLDEARKTPGALRVGAGGTWTAQDTARTLLERAGRVSFTRVPFPGGAAGVTALLGGHVDATLAYVAEFKGYYEAGKVVPLAVTGDARSPFLPDVPTFAELGIDIPVGVWRMLAGPAGMPADVVAALEKVFLETLEDPSTPEAFAKAGVNLRVRGAADSARFLAEQHGFYARLVKDFGLEPK